MTVHGEDRIFSTAQAVNTLLATWTVFNRTSKRLSWINETPSDVKTLVSQAVSWLEKNTLSGRYKPYNAFFSGSTKGMSDSKPGPIGFEWSTLPLRHTTAQTVVLPLWFPANFLQYVNGTALPPTADLADAVEFIVGVSGVIDPDEYQKMVEQPHFGYATPTKFDGFNGPDIVFPFWSSEPYTYATVMLALAQLMNTRRSFTDNVKEKTTTKRQIEIDLCIQWALMAATAEKLPPNGGKTKGKTVDITKLSSGRLHPVPDECLGHEEESVYGIPEDVRPVYKVESAYAAPEEDGSGYGTPEDVRGCEDGSGYATPEDVRGCEDGSGYATPEDVRGYEEDESVHDKSGGADGNKTPGEEGGFAYKAKARAIGTWTRVTSSRVIVPAVGCGIMLLAAAVTAIILANHLGLGKTEGTHGSMMQEDMKIRATLQKSDPPFLTAFFDDNESASLEWLEPFANISLDSKTLPVTVTSLPTTDLNGCTRNPCQHGRCVNKDGGYKCTCNPGWTGQNCQQDLNECTGNPCQHGRCVNKAGGYKCTCNPGWTGHNCQQDLNECDGNPCKHGRCVNKDGGYKCTCNPGWTGQNCQQDLNECDRNPCLHGRCVNKDGGYKCTCNPGWTGQNCQQDLNECDGNPCQHGRCVNKDGGYKCTCNPGWTGQNCQQDLNECDGNPCEHGRCVNKDGGYNCACNPGWTGQNCQQDLNECDGNPCEHGRCVNKDGGYKCTCNPGWTGQNCQQDLNECDRNPCLHGRCVNKDGGYNCTCNPGWTGQNCQQAKPCPTGWSGYETHCYRLMRDKAKWEKANLQCERLGANLASITSRNEANFINGIITGGKWGVHLVWFGLHRNDGFRKFTDGSPVTYKNWQPGEPNNNRHFLSLDKPQDCVGMYSKTGSVSGLFFLFSRAEKGWWNDDQCYRPYPFICKRPK
ncbi:hypothetical protein Bbelb_106780 [Branchiostoma belcheri]|nr:hypothetical protein Bbelb_106780 [Branchiostoma belcheri]